MNKKVSTLLTVGLVLGGSLLSTSAFAQSYNNDAKARSQAVDKLVEGRAYYIAQEATKGTLTTSDNFLSITKGTGNDPVLTVGNIAVSEAGAIPTIGAEGAWFVKKDADGNLKFTNDKGVVLGFKLDGTKATKVSDVKSSLFFKDADALKILKTTGDGNYLTIGSGTNLSLEVSKTNISFFEADDKADVNVSAFRTTVGDNFSLDFGKDGLKGDSIFSNLTVVTVNQNSNSDYAEGLSTTGNQFYLMCEGDVEDDYTFDLAAANTKEIANFEKAKFIVLTTNRLAGSQFSNDANGYKYAVMTGKELNDAVKSSTVKFDADNAKYTAHKSYNQSDESYILKQSNVTVSKAATNVNVWLDSVSEGAVNYVASNIQDWHDTPVEIIAGKGTRVDVKTIATGRQIVNVLTQNSNEEFVLALSLDKDGDISANAKKSEAGVNYPMGQWLISADKGANTISLINTQDTDKKVSGISLYETEKSGEFTVKCTDNALNGKIVRFQTVTPSVYNGYANLDDTELAGKTFKLKVTKTTVFGEEVEAYLQANGAEVKYVLTPEKATEWTLTKNVDEDNVVDTMKVSAPYNYYDAKGKFVEVKADKNTLTNVFTYRLKADKNQAMHSADWNKLYLTTDFGVDEETSAGEIVIRQVALNKYKLLSTTDYSDVVESLNTSSNYAKEGNENIATGAPSMEEALNFELVAEEPAASLPAISKHVTFSVNGLNYIAMDSNSNGVVANETSTLKATVEDFTFWIDTVDAKAVTPSFFISKGDKMMVNGYYVAKAAYTAWENDQITEADYKKILAASRYDNNYRLKFTEATRAEGDTLMINDKEVVANEFKFNIVESEDGGYVLKNGTQYVGAINEQLVMTTKANAVAVEVSDASAPTSNEGVSTSEVKVVANDGSVVVKNAAGKNVVVSTILGQVVANEVLTSDNATINVPAGIVVVSVDGESFKVNVR